MKVNYVFVDPSTRLKYGKNEYTWHSWSVLHLDGLYSHKVKRLLEIGG